MVVKNNIWTFGLQAYEVLPFYGTIPLNGRKSDKEHLKHSSLTKQFFHSNKLLLSFCFNNVFAVNKVVQAIF